MTRRPSTWSMLPVAVLVLGVAGFAWMLMSNGDDPKSAIEYVDVAASSPTFATIGALADASDIVVHAVVVNVDVGRSITDPNQPQAGVITQLVQLDVLGSADGAPSPLIIEQEATLLDGTPITVNGIKPLGIGDEGIAFLVAGTDDRFPYTALVNHQAWLPIDTTGTVAPADASNLFAEWASRQPDELIEQLP